MDIRNIILESLEEYKNKSLILKEDSPVSQSLQYHIDNNLTLTNNIYRYFSNAYFDLINEVRELYNNGLITLNEEDTLMVESQTGEFVIMEGEKIYLDTPFVEEDELNEAKHRGKNVNLNKPFRTSGGPKKFAVYVKSKNGNIKKVSFGDPGLKVKNSNKKAAKSFRARHNCKSKKDRTTAGYWSCNVGRYAKQLGLSSSNSW